ncbi:MAG: hypothetical protein Q4F39_01300 [Bacteroidia bacterium]|nr:hypothetical protein [Bacteroidia bacterium]
MKNTLLLLLAACVMLSGCSKVGPELFKGNFSFKTGGYVEITGKTIPLDDSEPRDTVFIRHLPNESGQMHIVEGNGGKLKVTMNVTGGAPVVFDATATDDAITLVPVERTMPVYSDITSLIQDASMLLSIGGTGQRFQNTIIFDLEVSGKYEGYYIEGQVTKSFVNCIATENE